MTTLSNKRLNRTWTSRAAECSRWAAVVTTPRFFLSLALSYLTTHPRLLSMSFKKRAVFPDRPWGRGNNPKAAAGEFLKTDDRFVIDKDLESKVLITVAPDGYLKCVKD